jgi:hypothetical protein
MVLPAIVLLSLYCVHLLIAFRDGNRAFLNYYYLQLCIHRAAYAARATASSTTPMRTSCCSADALRPRHTSVQQLNFKPRSCFRDDSDAYRGHNEQPFCSSRDNLPLPPLHLDVKLIWYPLDIYDRYRWCSLGGRWRDVDADGIVCH